MVKYAHMKQIEKMESEELMTQRKLRTEVILLRPLQLEDMLAFVRKQYEMLRIEFEQNMAANEQTGPINKEMRNAHMSQIEQMESQELMTHKKPRTEVIQLKDMLAQVRKEYDMLRIEFEQNLAANEQIGPNNKEMRNLIQSFQTHNVQLKVPKCFVLEKIEKIAGPLWLTAAAFYTSRPFHFLSLKRAVFEELINAELTKSEELKNKLDDLKHELTKSRMHNEKLENGLVDTQVKLNSERKTVDQMSQDLAENRELATNRLVQFEKTIYYKDALVVVQSLKMELLTPVVVETIEHKGFQRQFSVLYNEAMQLKNQLEIAREELKRTKNSHMRWIEQTESEELMTPEKKLQFDDTVAKITKKYAIFKLVHFWFRKMYAFLYKEYGILRNEFEQTGPIKGEDHKAMKTDEIK